MSELAVLHFTKLGVEVRHSSGSFLFHCYQNRTRPSSLALDDVPLSVFVASQAMSIKPGVELPAMLHTKLLDGPTSGVVCFPYSLFDMYSGQSKRSKLTSVCLLQTSR